jgi:hypothetical protein
MPTYNNDLRLKEIATGDESGTWGTSTNLNLSLIADAFGQGTKQMAADANETFTMPDASADGTRSLYLKITSGVSLTVTRTVTLAPNTVSKVWIIENATTGSQIITIAQGSGATVNVPNGAKLMIVTDGAGAGAAVFNANPTETSVGTVTSVGGTGTVNGLTLTGTVTSSGSLTLGGTLANVNLTSQITGTLPIANGGTNAVTAAGARATILPAFAGNAGKGLAVNVGETDVEYIALPGSGTVTSVNISGGTTGLTATGGPITTTGTITLAGTLAVANGGTGLATLGAANQVLAVNSGATALEYVSVSATGSTLYLAVNFGGF